MKIVRYSHQGQTFWGVLQDDAVRALPGDPYGAIAPEGPAIALADVQLLAPVAPSKLLCIGLNYVKHAQEVNMPLPDEPMLFICAPSAIIGPGETIELAHPEHRTDFEAEIAIVIGQRCRRVAAADAASVILGYTICNDVSDRDQQLKDKQFSRAKSHDTYKPVGPWIETELDPADLRISLTQNGQIRQDSRTSDLIFSLGQIVEFLSGVMTLEPGDVIITGTPAGVGPMKAGDMIAIEIEGIGRLENPVR